MCPKCKSSFFYYDPDMGCYVCHDRRCMYVDKSKKEEYRNKQEKALAYC